MKACGFCDEPGESWFHKDRAAGAGKNEQALAHCACRVRGAEEGEAEQGASSAKCSLSRHPLGMRLQRGWEGSQRARSCQGGGREPVGASYHTKTPGEGVEAPS